MPDTGTVTMLRTTELTDTKPIRSARRLDGMLAIANPQKLGGAGEGRKISVVGAPTMTAQVTRTARYFRIACLATLGVVAIIAVHAGLRVEAHSFTGYVPWDILPTWTFISVIIFFAAILSSIVGFAFSAIAGALILHYVTNGVEAVQIMMIASIGIQAYSIAGLSRSIQWSRCAPFIVGGVAALPIGIVLLLNLQPRTYVLAMGAALVIYGLYMLLRRPALIKSGPRHIADALVGALGGITGPLAAFPGAGVTIWCAMREWDKVEQRAVYQPYILIMQLLGIGTLFLLQSGSTFDLAVFAYALPGLAGAVIGLRVFRALTDLQFQRMLNLALVASGLALLFK